MCSIVTCTVLIGILGESQYEDIRNRRHITIPPIRLFERSFFRLLSTCSNHVSLAVNDRNSCASSTGARIIETRSIEYQSYLLRTFNVPIYNFLLPTIQYPQLYKSAPATLEPSRIYRYQYSITQRRFRRNKRSDLLESKTQCTMHPAHPHHTRQLDAAPAMKAPPPKNHKHGTHDQVMDRNEMGRLGLGLQYHLGDPHEPTRRNSMMSSVYSGPSVESSHYTIDTDGFSLLNVVDEATEKSNDHKKKKEKKEKKLKLDEHGNPIKKMKSKKKVKEVDSADSQVPHHESHHHQTYTTDRQIHSEDYFLSQTDELEEFDDYFIKQNQQKQANRALLERNKSNDVAPFKSHLDDDEPRQWYKSNSESAHMTPRTNRSVHTGTTMSSTESFPPPPVMSIDVHRDMNIYEDDDNNNDETRDTAEFHGEMLQGFLQRNGHDQQLALQTAMAFEAFLRQQQEKMARFNEICGSSQQSQSKTNSFGEAHYGEDVSFEDHDLEIMEKRGFHSAGSFPPLNSREDITFGSNRDLNIQKQHACHQYNTLLQGERWPSTQQNEDFLYRLPCDGLASERDTMLYRNMVAASQRDIAAHPQFNLFSSHMPTNEMAPYPAPGLSRNVSAEQTPYEQQMASLSVEKRACVIHLKMKWERRVHGESVLPDEWYIRFAKCSPGEPFDAKSAWRIMTKFDQRYLNLSILSMEKQLLSKIIFPCPGLKSKAGHDSKSEL